MIPHLDSVTHVASDWGVIFGSIGSLAGALGFIYGFIKHIIARRACKERDEFRRNKDVEYIISFNSETRHTTVVIKKANDGTC